MTEIAGTEHMEITLNPDMIDWLEDYLGQEIQVNRHILENERQKNG